MSMCDKHNMFHQMDDILRLTYHFTEEDFVMLMDSWDDEFKQYMIHLEKKISKFMMGHIKWRPTIGIWISHRWLLQRVCLWMQGHGIPDSCNMFCNCHKMNLPNPYTSTYGSICVQIMVTDNEIQQLVKDAPALRRQHLLDLIKAAEKNDDAVQAKAIMEILQQEAQKKTWRCINHSTCPPCGSNPLAIQVETPTSLTTYDTEESVFDNAMEHLSLRFRSAYTAPIFSSGLLDFIGCFSNTQYVLDILEGNYTFPPDTDKWTATILEKAYHTFVLLVDKKIDTTISVSNFQGYWQQADKTISSLFSCLHFGNYKAASFSKDLSALHAAKLTACRKKGIPLSRWTIGLTVLLKKMQGNNKIHKMRAICLFEGDFNYHNKTVFAHRMLASAQEKDQISIECFAKKNSNCINAVMTKVVFCNELCTHHHPTCIGGNNFGNCYDRMAHPPASMALQSFGVPRPAIRVLLLAMQTMRFFLRTGYGKLDRSYGGSMEDRTLGLGQDNAAAGPGFFSIKFPDC